MTNAAAGAGTTQSNTSSVEETTKADSKATYEASPKTTKPVESNVSSTSDSTESKTVVYNNCTDVRAAGAAPLHQDDPGYSKKLDRDGDGVACE
ncbi:excalibur calcium-binding domain-containing protein [Paenibacillus sp. CCS19]|uniref:excalibur calcium-binding domain-containing protein n=1 Tax=Paenibacillus sp. CCS19 TaxID=3158387 RepID=UPI00295EE6FC|nr:excalibur calcium-binding domain-containing protein [Paenibacillus cellulosilyticus]